MSKMKIKAIGLGAAGNKAVIQLIEQKVLRQDEVLILNTTIQDIPGKYRTNCAIEFGSTKGCGKERNLGKQYMLEALQDGRIAIDAFIEGDEKFFIIVTSTEGGTGSGSSIVLGEYLQETIKAPVHMVSFTGFEDDVRGLKNTMDWFKDLNDKFIVRTISNKKCLQFVNNNRRKAEEYANNIFVEQTKILIGQEIQPSDNNIDNMDFFKINATSGYMTVHKVSLDKINDTVQFNEVVQQALNESTSYDTDPPARRIGVIVNARPKVLSAIDDSYSVITKKYGIPLELFRHVQESHDENYINIVASGLQMPTDEIRSIYTKFQKSKENLNMNRDSFFSNSDNFNTDFGSDLDIGSYGQNPVATDQATRAAGKSSFFQRYAGAKKQNITINTPASKAVDEL